MRRIRFAEDPAHVLMHNPAIEFSRLGDAVPHQHMEFNSQDRVEELKNVFLYLKKQEDSIERRNLFNKISQQLNEDRLKCGDQALPPEIQAAINDYNFTIPFLPSQEIELLLKQFSDYLQSDSFAKKAEDVGVYSEKLLRIYRDCFYSTSLQENLKTPQERQLNNFYKNLLGLRIELLRLDAEPYYCTQKASDYLESILRVRFLEFSKIDSSQLIHLLNAVERLLTVRNKERTQKASLMFAAMAALGVGFSELYLYYRFSDMNTSLSYSVLYGSLAGIVGYTTIKTADYISRPLFHFFGNKNAYQQTETLLAVINPSEPASETHNDQTVFLSRG
ncbi:hypothetical protein [Legionella fairfieldensis]|uniref:hypothetical protein n=2 Tax=Legionella fairfieldensis TaxID=45064 RepID=UPI0013EF9547|nr:hypothetical protein [Legionella fairfieldensis]